MPAPRLRVTPPGWPRLPRHSARLRLTVLYGGVFLVCGAAVLALTDLLDGYAAHLATDITRLPLGAFAGGTFGRAAQRAAVPPANADFSKEQAQAAAVRAALAQIAFDRDHLLITSAIALAAVAVAAVAIGWVIAGRVLRPLSTITAAARRISASSLHERLALSGPGRTHRGDGHGLGLPIVRAIAAAHGATITARPRPGGGMVIDIVFPPLCPVSSPQTRGQLSHEPPWRDRIAATL